MEDSKQQRFVNTPDEHCSQGIDEVYGTRGADSGMSKDQMRVRITSLSPLYLFIPVVGKVQLHVPCPLCS